MVFNFGLGMTSAIIRFGKGELQNKLLHRAPWGIITACLSVVVYLFLLSPNLPFREFLVFHLINHSQNPLIKLIRSEISPLVGAATACFILWGTESIRNEKQNQRALIILQSNSVKKLGDFSYSLYLTHSSVLGLLWIIFLITPGIPLLKTILFLFCAPVICLGLAYLFHLGFEKPFLPTHLRRGESKSLERQTSET